jgi:hypothetical protein
VFKKYRPQARSMGLIRDIKSVVDELVEQWPITLRQIFYRLIGAYGYAKTDQFSSKVQEMLAELRRGGQISMDVIRDDTLTVIEQAGFTGVPGFWKSVRYQAEHYARLRQEGQKFVGG